MLLLSYGILHEIGFHLYCVRCLSGCFGFLPVSLLQLVALVLAPGLLFGLLEQSLFVEFFEYAQVLSLCFLQVVKGFEIYVASHSNISKLEVWVMLLG